MTFDLHRRRAMLESPSFLVPVLMLSVASLPDPRSRLPVFSGAGFALNFSGRLAGLSPPLALFFF